MIRIDNGILEIKGSKEQLIHDTCKLLRKLAEQGIMDKDMMLCMVETCFMSDEEFIQIVREIINGKEEKTEEDKVMSDILDTMETLLNLVERKNK